MPLSEPPPGKRLTLTETTGTRYPYSTGQALTVRVWSSSHLPRGGQHMITLYRMAGEWIKKKLELPSPYNSCIISLPSLIIIVLYLSMVVPEKIFYIQHTQNAIPLIGTSLIVNGYVAVKVTTYGVFFVRSP